jgi:hypothetical protein
MANKFQPGNIVYLQSDVGKEVPMTVKYVHAGTGLYLDQHPDSKKVFYCCTWLNALKKLETGDFEESLICK